MAILNPTDFPIVATTTSGTQLADILNRLYAAYESNQSQATRPTQVTAGGLWTKVAGTKLSLMMFNGTNDVEIGYIDGTNYHFGTATALAGSYDAAKAYQAGDIIFDPATNNYLQAKADKAAGAYNAGDWRNLGLNVLAAIQPTGFLPLSGGTLTGQLRLPAAAPLGSAYAVTRQYVDDQPGVLHEYTKAQRGAILPITFAANMTPDFSLSNNFSLNLTGNGLLNNPGNTGNSGQSGIIAITQGGGHTLTFGSKWKFPDGKTPTVSTTAGSIDLLAYYIADINNFCAKLIKDFK